MKRRLRFIHLLAGLTAALLLLCACGRSVTVTFDPVGGTVVDGEIEQSVTVGEDASPPTLSREGYIFAGWDGSYLSVTDDCVLHARWDRAYTITFDPGEGVITAGDAVVTRAEGAILVPPEAEREHYELVGWDPEPVAVEGDAVYTAVWSLLPYSSQELYELISPAVVEITIYDRNGNATAIGSGFFIDDEGTLLTNYHVIEGAYEADATLSDGSIAAITAVLGYDETLDLALLRCGYESESFLPLSEREVLTGDTVYAMGSSEGLTGTFSSGNVSAADREMDGVSYIQTTAPISHGNSGGPLVNVYGEVIGVNTMMLVDGQNLNFAINIHEAEALSRDRELSMPDFYAETGGAGSSAGSTGGDGTLIDDPGAEIYSLTDTAEWEPNDMPMLADELQNGPWTAGYVDVEDLDFYHVSVDSACELKIWLLPYYIDDLDYLGAVVVTADIDVICDESGSEVGWITEVIESDEGDGSFLYGEVPLPAAGDYYIAILLPDGYPYATGCFYAISAEW